MIGYIVTVSRKSKIEPEFFCPLSLGRPNEPFPDELLRRGRATVFADKNVAMKVLEKTLKAAAERGYPWPKKYQYLLIEATQ